MATFSTQFTTTVSEHNTTISGVGAGGVFLTLAANELAYVAYFSGTGSGGEVLEIVTPNVPSTLGTLVTSTIRLSRDIYNSAWTGGGTDYTQTNGNVANDPICINFLSDPSNKTPAEENLFMIPPGSTLEFRSVSSAGAHAFKAVIVRAQ